MSVVFSAHTPDGRWRVYLYHDQTADLYNERRFVVLHRVSLRTVGEYLAAHGVDPDDLVPDEPSA
jgi:hypothetical protein